MKSLAMLVLGFSLCGLAFLPGEAIAQQKKGSPTLVPGEINKQGKYGKPGNLNMSGTPRKYGDNKNKATAKTPSVNAGKIKTGNFFAVFTFTIQAGNEKIKLGLLASDLYLGDDPLNRKSSPIPVDTSKPAEIIFPSTKNRSGGVFHAGWGPASQRPIEGKFAAKRTTPVEYEVGPNVPCEIEVSVKVFYQNSDPTRRLGEYRGRAKLFVYPSK